eukprot:scaffold51553_cov30-Tisochrysis_lutea.AAC.2
MHEVGSTAVGTRRGSASTRWRSLSAFTFAASSSAPRRARSVSQERSAARGTAPSVFASEPPVESRLAVVVDSTTPLKWEVRARERARGGGGSATSLASADTEDCVERPRVKERGEAFRNGVVCGGVATLKRTSASWGFGGRT